MGNYTTVALLHVNLECPGQMRPLPTSCVHTVRGEGWQMLLSCVFCFVVLGSLKALSSQVFRPCFSPTVSGERALQSIDEEEASFVSTVFD